MHQHMKNNEGWIVENLMGFLVCDQLIEWKWIMSQLNVLQALSTSHSTVWILNFLISKMTM